MRTIKNNPEERMESTVDDVPQDAVRSDDVALPVKGEVVESPSLAFIPQETTLTPENDASGDVKLDKSDQLLEYSSDVIPEGMSPRQWKLVLKKQRKVLRKEEAMYIHIVMWGSKRGKTTMLKTQAYMSALDPTP